MKQLFKGRSGRALSALTIIAVLSVANPVQAGTAQRTGGVWRWLEALWGDGFGRFARTWTGASPASRAEKDTVCPPAGCPDPTPTPPPSQPADQGGGVDPDGKSH
ncbi:MAG TPA: hypothetical protein VF173_34230 [Thermoanaerobaculia bacterium]|nr:hypothetical protein [Thermoanaerobaculia bacterium]